MKIQSTNEHKNSVKSQILLRDFYIGEEWMRIFYPFIRQWEYFRGCSWYTLINKRIASMQNTERINEQIPVLLFISFAYD